MIRAIATCTWFERLRSCYRRFRFFADNRGVSAVEFALILPVMMGLYLGGVEVTKAINLNRKVTLVARTLSDLVAQVAKVNATDIANVLTAGEAVAWPYNDSTLKMRVSSVEIDPQGVATIKWSRARNWTARADGETLSGADAVPAALKLPNTTLVWSEVEYRYAPAIGGGFSILKEGITLKDKIYMRPRLTDKVVCDPC